jgi:CheY-like chemotaxis protein
MMRVLIAHSSRAERADVMAALRRVASEPFVAMASDDGRQVLDLLLDESPPELALVDWDLPEVEGPELCRLVRDFHQGHTYLVVLAGADREDTADARRAGAAQCLRTPLSEVALGDCFTTAQRRARARAAKADSRHQPEADSGDQPASVAFRRPGIGVPGRPMWEYRQRPVRDEVKPTLEAVRSHELGEECGAEQGAERGVGQGAEQGRLVPASDLLKAALAER